MDALIAAREMRALVWTDVISDHYVANRECSGNMVSLQQPGRRADVSTSK
jgi:hypothetical protein